MFVIDNETLLCQEAVRRCIDGLPTNSLANWAAAQKVVDLSAARARLRPPLPSAPAARKQQ